jgi:hypothetical protein
MSRTARSTFALVMALTFLLGAAAAHALPAANGPAVERTPGTMAAVWSWLSSVFEVKGDVARFFDMAKTVQDPNPPSSPTSDVGGFIDPNGGL